jgi:hypothetical protein
MCHCSLLTAIKPKALKERFRTAATWVVYIPNYNVSIKVAHFSKIYYHTSLQDDNSRACLQSSVPAMLATLNQPNAQTYSSDTYNITLNIPTRFAPQGTIFRDSIQSNAA